MLGRRGIVESKFKLTSWDNYVPNEVFFSYIQSTVHIHILIIHEFRYLQKLCQTMLSQFKVCIFIALPPGAGVTEKSGWAHQGLQQTCRA